MSIVCQTRWELFPRWEINRKKMCIIEQIMSLIVIKSATPCYFYQSDSVAGYRAFHSTHPVDVHSHSVNVGRNHKG